MYAYFGVKGVGWETHDSLRNKRRSMTICIKLIEEPACFRQLLSIIAISIDI